MKTFFKKRFRNRNDCRYEQLDQNSLPKHLNDAKPTIIAHRKTYYDYWTYNRLDRISTSENIKKLIQRRRELLAENHADTHWVEFYDKVIAHGCNVTGKTINPYNGTVQISTVSPSQKRDGSILFSKNDKLPVVVDDKCMTVWSRGQRHMLFRKRIINMIEELLTIAGKDRLPPLPQETKLPIEKMGRVNLCGLTILYTVDNRFVTTSNCYIHWWKLYYISETNDIEYVEI